MIRKIAATVSMLCFAMTAAGQARHTSMWLIAGQSNASGMGDRRSSLKYDSPVCFDYVERGDSLRPLRDPAGEDGHFFGKANSGSIAPSFAWHLNRLTGDSIVIVSAGRGGSACSTPGESDFGTWAGEGRLTLFPACAEKTRKARKLTGLGFSGIVWIQGERDANAINTKWMTGADYEAALRDLIARFRAELGGIPVYIVLTGQYVHRPQEGFLAVRAAQRRVAQTVPGVYLATIDPWMFPELNLMTDDIHYSQLGYNLIGEALARQIAEK